MEAKELRIGNYVNHKDNWSYRQPKNDFKEFYFKWDDSDFHAMLECTLDIKDMEPIPLTEDILLKCGFEVYEFDNGQSNQYRFKDRLIVIRDNKFVDYGTSVILNYVHTIQNLYFALTGEELEVKL